MTSALAAAFGWGQVILRTCQVTWGRLQWNYTEIAVQVKYLGRQANTVLAALILLGSSDSISPYTHLSKHQAKTHTNGWNLRVSCSAAARKRRMASCSITSITRLWRSPSFTSTNTVVSAVVIRRKTGITAKKFYVLRSLDWAIIGALVLNRTESLSTLANSWIVHSTIIINAFLYRWLLNLLRSFNSKGSSDFNNCRFFERRTSLSRLAAYVSFQASSDDALWVDLCVCVSC